MTTDEHIAKVRKCQAEFLAMVETAARAKNAYVDAEAAVIKAQQDLNESFSELKVAVLGSKPDLQGGPTYQIESAAARLRVEVTN